MLLEGGTGSGRAVVHRDQPNPIVPRGPELLIERANDAACRMWARSASQVHHRALFNALPELRGQGFEVLLENVMRTGETYTGRGVPAASQGNGALETLYFDFVYSPLRGTNRRVDAILVWLTTSPSACAPR